MCGCRHKRRGRRREISTHLHDVTRALGPPGPFPDAPLRDELERRWLHYALLSRDGELGLVANLAWLGPGGDAGGGGQRMGILLLHEREHGWQASQFNCEAPLHPWSSFRVPHAHGQPGELTLRARSGEPAVALRLMRTSRPCTSQCAPFADTHHLRWQSEPGIIATGDWDLHGRVHHDVDAVGYHERVRGRWGWPEMGGWVFGFVNDPRGAPDAAPATAIVFTLIQPSSPPGAATGSMMLWRSGRMRRHFPRRNLNVVVDGHLDRDRVTLTPDLAGVLGVPPMQPVPRRLVVRGKLGRDEVMLDFSCESSARVVIPSETGLRPYSVHEVIGACRVEGAVSGQSFSFDAPAIVEFAGGAVAD